MPSGVYKHNPNQLFQKGHKVVGGFNTRFTKGKPNPHNKEWNKKISDANRGKPKLKFRGENSPKWKGGISSENNKIRNSFEYKLWRKTVYERDDFTCQRCGQNGGKLVVHHINNFAEFPELRLAIDNGITLCKECHKEFHKLYGIKNNTREQLEEFVSVKNLN